ncbi:MAG: hypothetical protein QXE81_03630 [Desulfurococcaceae archaeon]
MRKIDTRFVLAIIAIFTAIRLSHEVNVVEIIFVAFLVSFLIIVDKMANRNESVK